MFGGTYKRDKNEIKKYVGFYKGKRGFICGILRYIMISQFHFRDYIL